MVATLKTPWVSGLILSALSVSAQAEALKFTTYQAPIGFAQYLLDSFPDGALDPRPWTPVDASDFVVFFLSSPADAYQLTGFGQAVLASKASSLSDTTAVTSVPVHIPDREGPDVPAFFVFMERFDGLEQSFVNCTVASAVYTTLTASVLLTPLGEVADAQLAFKICRP